jgi:hypothetical protein
MPFAIASALGGGVIASSAPTTTRAGTPIDPSVGVESVRSRIARRSFSIEFGFWRRTIARTRATSSARARPPGERSFGTIRSDTADGPISRAVKIAVFRACFPAASSAPACVSTKAAAATVSGRWRSSSRRT